MRDFGRLRRIGFRRSASIIRAEVDEELQLHIELRARALERAGVSAEAARAQALAEFGDLDDAREFCAGAARQLERRRRANDWLSELRQDAGYALRVLGRAPAFALASVLTLAVALGASTAMYAVLHTYLIRALPYPDADRLMFVRSAPESGAPALDHVNWAPVDSVFASVARWNLDGFTIPGDAYTENVTGAWVARGFFETLGVRPVLGRGFHADEYRVEAPVVILSHDLWLRRFHADTRVIGSTIRIHSTEQPAAPSLVTVVGVTGPDFWPIHWRESELLRPLAPATDEPPYLVRLAKRAAPASAEQRLNDLVRAQVSDTIDPSRRFTLVPALQQHSANVRQPLLALFCSALFMLLAACGSVGGTLVSRLAARRGEFAIRVALGGSRARVVRQLLTESAVLGVLSGALGLALAYLLLDAGGVLIEQQLGTTVPGGPAALRPDPFIVLLSAIASTLAGTALGVLPAFAILRSGDAAGAKLPGRSHAANPGTTRLRRVLIAGQVAVAIVLMFGAGLMFRTLARIARTDVGFRTQGVIAATLMLPASNYPDSSARRVGMERLLTRLQASPDVRNAAAVFPEPFWGSGGFPVFVEGAAPDADAAPRSGVYTVSPTYFETMDIPLRAGRAFRAPDDHAAPLVVVVSERLAARIAPQGSALGRRIRVRVPHLASWADVDDQAWRTVVGVVGDTRKGFASAQPEAPDLYVPYAQNPRAWQSIVVRTDRAEAAQLEPIKRAIGSVDRTIAISDVSSLTQLAAHQVGQRHTLLVLLGFFAAFALGLSALALYASLYYTVIQRRAELAVRRAVGASAVSLLRLVAGEGVLSVALGVVTGAIASLALGRFLRSQLYGVDASDPATLAAIALVLTVAALAACIVPCLRALHTDPALALRE